VHLAQLGDLGVFRPASNSGPISLHSATREVRRRRSALRGPSAAWTAYQSPVAESWAMATSMMNSWPTRWPNRSATANCSPLRCRNGRTSIVPLRRRTPVGSISPTRAAFTKMLRRCTEDTNPSTRAGAAPEGAMTTSDTLPMADPSAARRASRASRET